ncbi:hypothetical protein WA577_002199 [Blastocystis sp. JDR]
MFALSLRRLPFAHQTSLLTRSLSLPAPSFNYVPIKQILKGAPGEKTRVYGWVRSKRVFKDFSFIVVNDGSNVNGIQCILPKDHATNINNGSSICIDGELVRPQSERHKDALELRIASYQIIGDCDQTTYPLQKKFYPPEFLRTIPHLRPRTNMQGVVTRMRNSIMQSIHSSFQQQGFVQVMSPIITSNDCEGAGDMFSVAIDKPPKPDLTSYFNSKAYLTVSGQLHAEMMAHAMSRVYTFGPTFRAENSNTTRHLCEFWMVEPELCFAGLGELMDLAVTVIKNTTGNLLEHNQEDLAFLQQRVDKTVVDRLETLQNRDNYCHITYTEAIQALSKKGLVFDMPVKWGIDLQAEHEKYLCEVYCKNRPVFVTHYPEAIKPFYMKRSSNDTVEAMDLLVPRLREIIGGSVREENYDVLKETMLKRGLLSPEYTSGRSTKALDWYLDLRRYGSTPHAGWGLGLERFIELCTGVANIRDVIPVPRVPNSCLLLLVCCNKACYTFTFFVVFLF